ncbi:uncharacterized protein BXZ73DRAFT_92367 [Epithele typhae]|uniref:uncharacterized protein n=1 Tax=Epithele typhae TaxID=378194 RepID=UPI0020087C54|nr:uncharacterized protein BXZ73DRAFT_93823 [Epithele typhae]XP_047873690.1 uncharacterized protein BXZ73DRAFT_92367 [Epithele typhae]KAH9910377.1 hypothetical protein BXZ73DRAFT_93823 [Epithele typhae]KAH9917697.1 hypothetical protein BXZ73DRAFT_92367 [Epithele typhae]
MFRLPTHLETLVPPPRDQLPQSQPWRGSLLLPTSSPHPSRPREIRVTAAETENDNSQQEQWPRQFQLQVVDHRGVLRQVHQWVSQVQLSDFPRCMLMPDRLPDQAVSRDNQAQFEGLARHLLENETVAVARWDVNDPSTPGGLLLYPTSTTRTLMVGVVFLTSEFPSFLGLEGPQFNSAIRSIYAPALLPRLQPFQPVVHHTPFDPAPPHISSASRHSASGPDPSKNRSGRNSG